MYLLQTPEKNLLCFKRRFHFLQLSSKKQPRGRHVNCSFISTGTGKEHARKRAELQGGDKGGLRRANGGPLLLPLVPVVVPLG